MSAGPLLETSAGTYLWLEQWATVPEPFGSPGEGRTHGVACSTSGDIFIFCQAVPSVLRFSSCGELLDRWGEYPGAHGMTLVEDDGEDFLWLTDEFSGKVEKCTLGGGVVQALGCAPHPAYESEKYIPTWVAVDEVRHGGNGDIWVADGYGAHLVHRFSADGRHLLTLDGTEGAGRFSCPHGLGFDHRRGRERALYIADRGNRRFQVFDGEGKFLRAAGEGLLTSPDTFVSRGDIALVPELLGRLTILDGQDRELAVLGENRDLRTDQPGWANDTPIKPGFFNAPHSCAIDHLGHIYVVEWRTGGRIIKLERK